ncbi:CPBP family intramembrane metalloprotease [Planococcus shenhongbingii]|uniref:CPBP family intramembrane glutamic endopeptidase n=1 Tax=Planococcus shenhongbingii TaxID=3058398 RepID=UPI002638C509|nr:CPBP family intramembrane glutamic endopeptidase [Planococcus sp. N016]WKA59208.1 CPBP family intramembrane metalloprotease [Planococcus sp. N016]
MVLILGFILVRDNMSTFKFWEFGLIHNLPWMRFTENGMVLITLGLMSLILTGGIVFLQKDRQKLLFWISDQKLKSYLVGVAGAAIVVLPFWLIYLGMPLEERGGSFPKVILPFLLFFALSGNLMEEVLFRGYLQGYFETVTSSIRAAFLAALFFYAGHIFLATTVTGLGLPLLLFTLYEGIICSFVQRKHGILPSTLTHGLAIFLLSAALF